MNHHAIHQSLDLLGFLTLGLLSGFGHCAGMCAPFVLFVSRRYGGPPSAPGGFGVASATARAALTAQGWYTAGRIATYACLGALAGAFGSAVTMAGGLLGVRRGAALVAGALLVVWAVVALSDALPRIIRPTPDSTGATPRHSGSTVATAVPNGLFRNAAGLLRGRVPGHPFAMGLLLGLLPCGMVYSAVVASIALGSALSGAAALALFGLGTAPALLGLSLADTFLVARRALLNRLSQVFILAMGALFLWRALAR